ncbi:MAG: UDP-N-acetylglucosamine 2-epimerase (non-hydrolyzing) [Deltaproteobacteria bacterium]|nr:UDP-N-acetylglucosamine 2-epimerase (non-hydrolyzing) [Deltaproteobacteria bacterium]
MVEKTIHLVAAARPNFMKVAPLYRALSSSTWCRPQVVHTGQHYDYNMSAAFFADLGLPDPAAHLGVGSGAHGEQIGRCLMAYEQLISDGQRPDAVVVVGDVNSTLACGLVARRHGVFLVHLEAGLRSLDRDMPEEQNRILTDQLSDLLWTPSPDGDGNLAREGVDPKRVERVGNIMIDSLEMMRPSVESRRTWAELGLEHGAYGVVTLHRPNNVDDPQTLAKLADALVHTATRLPLVFPVHPRTRARLEHNDLLDRLVQAQGIKLVDPLGYLDFMSLVFASRLVITDSGGIQEETTYLHLPCLTVRPSTERPVTVELGTNRLVKVAQIEEAVERVLAGDWPHGQVPELWDGRTAQRCVDSLRRSLGR